MDETKSFRDWWGKELRNWRNARGLSSRALGLKVHLSGSMIERIEKNERLCDAVLAGKLDDALEAGGALRRLWRLVEQEASGQRSDADSSTSSHPLHSVDAQAKGMLGVDPPARLDRSLSPMERRAMMAASGLVAVMPGAFVDLIPHPDPAPVPDVVRPDDIEQVRTAAATIAEWDNQFGGGGIVRSSLHGQLVWARGLLEAACPSALEKDLFTAVGHLAIAMGASAFDSYQHDDATRLLVFGQRCAEHINNWHLRATALNWLARQAVWCGNPDDGLTHAEDGLVRADRLTPREQAMLHNASARAWARMGRRQEALAAIGRSDDAFSHAAVGEDVAWMSYYDHAQHHGDTGHAVFDLALLARQSTAMAAARLRTAIDGHTDDYVRSRALSGTKLATLIMTTGDPKEAVSIGHQALDEVGRLRSKRAIDDVSCLSRASARYAGDSDVAVLRDRIAAVIRA
ncbi:helix-turn-helix domain-containing protein [Streptomyces sp. NBC_00820]|uniref:helix-turn-helix domain-containing protein n=1 Tax=Streptomyces sp. NBC_00820 TaxID=2975842 RepID=UPI002ED55600|nr:helix-turn-helix domain-containing protein [Streptomyces sp. NBC_00820]